MNCCCVLVSIQFIWTVDTIGLMVVFGMENIAVIFMTSLQKWQQYGHHLIAILTTHPLPFKMVSDSSANKPVSGIQN